MSFRAKGINFFVINQVLCFFSLNYKEMYFILLFTAFLQPVDSHNVWFRMSFMNFIDWS